MCRRFVKVKPCFFTFFYQLTGNAFSIRSIKRTERGQYCDQTLRRSPKQLTGKEGYRYMLRGTQRHMIVVRTRNSPLFEEAYFVMRRDADRLEADQPDMLWEANRIIENSLPASREERRDSLWRRAKSGLWFLLGSLCGGGTVGLLWWLI